MQKLTELKNSILNYLKGVRAEWGKITWPEKKQVGAETFSVIVIVVAFTLFILLLDVIFKGLFGLLKL